MKAICTDGLVIDCGNFKAIDGGVILTEDVKRKRPIGFVPSGRLRYVLPDDVIPTEARDDVSETARSRPSETDVPSPTQRRTIARLRDRLDRLEATVDPSRTADNDTEDPHSSRSVDEPVSDEPAGNGRATIREHDDESDTLRVTDGDEEGRDAETTGSPSGGDPDPDPDIDAERDDSADDGQGAGDETYPALQRVDGLGPTYADRLHDGGIETIADLGTADAIEVAAVADVGETRAEGWVAQASELMQS